MGLELSFGGGSSVWCGGSWVMVGGGLWWVIVRLSVLGRVWSWCMLFFLVVFGLGACSLCSAVVGGVTRRRWWVMGIKAMGFVGHMWFLSYIIICGFVLAVVGDG